MKNTEDEKRPNFFSRVMKNFQQTPNDKRKTYRSFDIIGRKELSYLQSGEKELQIKPLRKLTKSIHDSIKQGIKTQKNKLVWKKTLMNLKKKIFQTRYKH